MAAMIVEDPSVADPGVETFEILSTHPASEARMDNLQRLEDKVSSIDDV